MHIIWDARQINNVRWKTHCVKSVQIRSFFWSAFSRTRTVYGMILRISPYSVRMRENTDQKKLRIWILFTQWMAVRVTEKKTTQRWNSFAEQITVFRCSLRKLPCNASVQSHFDYACNACDIAKNQTRSYDKTACLTLVLLLSIIEFQKSLRQQKIEYFQR